MLLLAVEVQSSCQFDATASHEAESEQTRRLHDLNTKNAEVAVMRLLARVSRLAASVHQAVPEDTSVGCGKYTAILE